jgi:hypothetical protein
MIHLDMVFWFLGILRHDKKFILLVMVNHWKSRTLKIKSWLNLMSEVDQKMEKNFFDNQNDFRYL